MNHQQKKSNNEVTRMYYDVLVSYSGTGNNDAHYEDRLSQALIDNPSEYWLVVDKFNVPTRNIPIFIFDPSAHHYTVELEYNGTYSGMVDVSYISVTPTMIGTPEYYYVYHYDIFLLMVNNALATAFTQLGAAITLPVGSIAPHLEIDLGSKIVSFVAQANFYDTTSLSPMIKVYMNNTMLSFLDGLPYIFYSTTSITQRDFQFQCFNKSNNIRTGSPSNFYIMESNYGSLTVRAWNVCKGLLLRTTHVPVRQEALPTSFDGTLQNKGSILANFDIAFDAADTKPTIIQYFPYVYKMIDLMGTNPINIFDIDIFWYDFQNNTHRIYMTPGDCISLRFVFIKKFT